MPRCSRCQLDKPESAFHHSANGRSKVCEQCLTRPRSRQRRLSDEQHRKAHERAQRRRANKRLANFNP